MFRKFGLGCAILAFFAIAGGHWAVLQTVAWAEMLQDYTHRSGNLTVALAQTFDGQHPCELCREIARAKSGEHRENPAAPGLKEAAKIKALLADSAPRPLARPAVEISFPPTVSAAGPSRTDAPPTPPPRRPSRAA